MCHKQQEHAACLLRVLVLGTGDMVMSGAASIEERAAEALP